MQLNFDSPFHKLKGRHCLVSPSFSFIGNFKWIKNKDCLLRILLIKRIKGVDLCLKESPCLFFWKNCFVGACSWGKQETFCYIYWYWVHTTLVLLSVGQKRHMVSFYFQTLKDPESKAGLPNCFSEGSSHLFCIDNFTQLKERKFPKQSLCHLRQPDSLNS